MYPGPNYHGGIWNIGMGGGSGIMESAIRIDVGFNLSQSCHQLQVGFSSLCRHWVILTLGVEATDSLPP